MTADPGGRPHVYKFGGTSVADAGRIGQAADLVQACPEPIVVVVSAVAGVTDRLERLATLAEEGRTSEWEAGLQELERLHLEILEELVRDLAPGASRPQGRGNRGEPADAIRTRIVRAHRSLETLQAASTSPAAGRQTEPSKATTAAEVSATGEDLSALLLVAALQGRSLAARAVDARTVVRTEARNGLGIPLDEETVRLAGERVAPLVRDGVVPVLQGYLGATEDGRTTTLGRGGSDFTAAIVGAALGAAEVTIWTDVEGIQTADPRVAPAARVLPELGFEEAVELAYFGARVIHPAATKHAAARNLGLRIRSSFEPDRPGTLIRPDRREGPSVAAVAHRGRIALITVRSRPLFMAHGFLARVFDVLARHALPVDLVATSHTSTAFTLDESENLEAVREELEAFAEVTIRQGLATVTVVGRGLLGRPGTTGTIFHALGMRSIRLISQASDVSLNFLVDEDDAPEIVRQLHEELIEKGGGG